MFAIEKVNSSQIAINSQNQTGIDVSKKNSPTTQNIRCVPMGLGQHYKLVQNLLSVFRATPYKMGLENGSRTQMLSHAQICFGAWMMFKERHLVCVRISSILSILLHLTYMCITSSNKIYLSEHSK